MLRMSPTTMRHPGSRTRVLSYFTRLVFAVTLHATPMRTSVSTTSLQRRFCFDTDSVAVSMFCSQKGFFFHKEVSVYRTSARGKSIEIQAQDKKNPDNYDSTFRSFIGCIATRWTCLRAGSLRGVVGHVSCVFSRMADHGTCFREEAYRNRKSGGVYDESEYSANPQIFIGIRRLDGGEGVVGNQNY